MPCGSKKYMSGGEVKQIAKKAVKQHEDTMHKASGGKVTMRGAGAAVRGKTFKRSVV